MSNLLLVYIPCSGVEEAKTIGRGLIKEHLAVCVNIMPQVESLYFWPPGSEEIAKETESVLVAKTRAELYNELEAFVLKNHSYDTPCVLAFEVARANKSFSELVRDTGRDREVL